MKTLDDCYASPREVLDMRLQLAQKDKQIIELQMRLLSAMTPSVDTQIEKAQQAINELEKTIAEAQE